MKREIKYLESHFKKSTVLTLKECKGEKALEQGFERLNKANGSKETKHLALKRRPAISEILRRVSQDQCPPVEALLKEAI